MMIRPQQGRRRVRRIVSAVAVVLTLICSAETFAQRTLSPVQIQAAIAYGKQFRTRDHYLDAGMKRQKYQLSSAFAADGISKYLLFFTDYDIVAAEAAAANHQMRELSDAEVQKLPLLGLVFVNVLLHARGTFPVERLQSKYTGENLHLVLQIGDTVLQPVARSDMRDTGVVPPSGPIVVRSWSVGNTSIITTDQLGFSAERVEVEFAFQIPTEAADRKAKAILIDGGGKHHVVEVDLAEILHLQPTALSQVTEHPAGAGQRQYGTTEPETKGRNTSSEKPSSTGNEQAQTTNYSATAGGSLASVGIKVRAAEVPGAQIMGVAAGSAAEQAGLHVGDVIDSVDGISIKTPEELAAELSHRAPGAKIRMGYMIRTPLGSFRKEAILVIQQK